mmetsp:Transcript_10962/g.13534  ORF Transcript_10962/g.13534 Transcript_10962/m.13534 type:complete len:588 (-) Transcript_10962:88-1851(-)|eukprot:CAMPEP_0206187318 /NCGR_PEP_ID=MMETSP0166-20121206/2925_1 /ASSEMBLY_ACC=CAM_ASM_000260 /TAXON_ID=95228 /ORGANISM="Vannella robusta, Strain DIVA3 518/3/11/1/6" /LENGTH=587 /DNA_ID=CAMNT_0053602867 /DNA_START=464 /DNA_END=2227 /DNA_ORIENTATION=+
MCGIIAVLTALNCHDQLMKLRRRITHRGPDYSGVYSKEQGDGSYFAHLIHERLCIVDPESGKQPFVCPKTNKVLAVNGEIYNHQQQRAKYSSYPFQTKSDCEVIIPWLDETSDYDKLDFSQLDGMFGFVVWDENAQTMFVARDPIGIIPLYYGCDMKKTNFWFASEMKVLSKAGCDQIYEFPPGHYAVVRRSGDAFKMEMKRYHTKFDVEYPKDALRGSGDALLSFAESSLLVRSSFEKAVKKMLMSDVPYGVLLSGGLDSSLVASIAARYAAKRIESGDTSDAWWPKLHSFSIGLPGSPDTKFAKIVADHIGTVHHGFEFTVQEGIDALADVIYHVETYDITTIRASTPMFLLSRKIKAMGVKMVLSGEGSDEIFGGYLYFHKAPNPTEFHDETVRKLKVLHSYDCARANKSSAAWGLECRPPFLDTEFVENVLRIPSEHKMITKDQPIEKYLLRHAFDKDAETGEDLGYLPKEVLWRQKEQFSDGVGYSWIDKVQEYAQSRVSDEEMETAEYTFPINTPKTKEGYMYRRIFEARFPGNFAAKTVAFEESVACSTAKALEWDQSFKNRVDPSGRAISGVHIDYYKN